MLVFTDPTLRGRSFGRPSPRTAAKRLDLYRVSYRGPCAMRLHIVNFRWVYTRIAISLTQHSLLSLFARRDKEACSDRRC